MLDKLAYLMAGFGLCYAGGTILGNHLKKVASPGFRQLVVKCSKNGWAAGLWGIGFNVVLGRASMLA
ncbi:hypothetical protein OAM01_03420, partial [bacterium]|nr:hypothetical protein [bacterium]